MKPFPTATHILLAEDDDDQYAFIVEVFRKARLVHELTRFKHGADLLDYLLARNAHKDRVIDKTVPCIILLDMDMPVMEGKETLKVLKTTPALRKIPAIMLTGSESPKDVEDSYDLGAASYIRKPLTFAEFLAVISAFELYWFNIVALPMPVDLPGRSV